jgi:SAM-dependent methyltransferase
VDALLEATARAETRHFWFVGFRSFVQPLLDEACAGRPGLRLLDCGCGTGSNLAMLGRSGLAFGFDLSLRGLAFAREAGHTRIARATVDAIPFPDATFDVATSFDVIYALPEKTEHDALAEMHRVLRPGGALLINVAGMPILKGDHSVLSEELRRYTRGRLRSVVEGAGFDVVRLTYTNASLFPLMLAVRAVQRLGGLAAPENAALEITTPPGPANAALAGLLKLEARALRRVNMPFGSSLLCVARRRMEVSARPGRAEVEPSGRGL